MKRSKMIKLLQGYVFDASDSTAQLDFEDADLLLSFIEKAGMLPPVNDEKSFKIQKNGELTYQVNEWEPEDE